MWVTELFIETSSRGRIKSVHEQLLKFIFWGKGRHAIDNRGIGMVTTRNLALYDPIQLCAYNYGSAL
jgi:hypothetical protein